jgi:hypothetical protein
LKLEEDISSTPKLANRQSESRPSFNAERPDRDQPVSHDIEAQVSSVERSTENDLLQPLIVRQVLNLPIAPTIPTPDVLRHLSGVALGRKGREPDAAEAILRPAKGVTSAQRLKVPYDRETFIALEEKRQIRRVIRVRTEEKKSIRVVAMTNTLVHIKVHTSMSFQLSGSTIDSIALLVSIV